MKGNKNAIPPDRTKYGFKNMIKGEERLIEADYNLVSKSARQFNINHPQSTIKVIKDGKNVLIKRTI